MIKNFINENTTNKFIQEYNKKQLTNFEKQDLVSEILNIEEKFINSTIENNIFNFLTNDLFLAKDFLINFSNLGFFCLNNKLLDNIEMFNYKDTLDLILHLNLPKKIVSEFFNTYQLSEADIKSIKSKTFKNLAKLSLKDKLQIEEKIGNHLSLMYVTKDYYIEEKNEIIEFLKERYAFFSKKELHHIFKNNLFIYDIDHLVYIKRNYSEVFNRISKYIDSKKLIEVEKKYLAINLRDF